VAGGTSLAVKAGRLVGRVDGEVSCDSETRPLRGVRVFVIAGLLAVVLLVIRFLQSVVTGLPGLIGSLIPAVLVLVAFLWIYGMLFGKPTALLRGAGRAARSGAAAGARATARGAAKGTAGGARAGARMTSSSSGLATTVPVRRFRVRALTGELVACVQQGELLGDEVRHGDHVLVEGRRTRAGHLAVRRVEVLQGPTGPALSVVRTRHGSAAAVVADRVALVAGLAVAAWAAVEVVRMVS
jgi:hypothetical protein